MIGIEFLVIRREVENALLELPAFLQETGNIGHNTRNTLTKMQAMLQIHRMGVASNPMGECNWDMIATQISQSQPHLSAVAKSLCEFVAKWSGGINPTHLREVEAFSKSLAFTRETTAPTWDLLSKLPLSQFPEYVIAMVKALLASPEAYCRSGETKLLCSADVATLNSTNKDNVQEACKVLRQAKAFLDSLDAPENVKTKLYGDMGVRIVMFVHKKTIKSRKHFSGIAEISSQFSADILKFAPMQAMQLGLPFPEPAAVSAAQQSPSTTAPLVQFDADGVVSPSTVLAKGFKVNAKVKHAESPEEFTIVAVGQTISLRSTAKGATDLKEVSPAVLLDEYRKLEVVVENTITDMNPLQHNDLKMELAKAKLLNTIVKAYEDYDRSEGVKVTIKGSRRSVFATREYEAGALVLVPLCTHVSTTFGTLPDKVVSFGSLYTHGDEQECQFLYC